MHGRRQGKFLGKIRLTCPGHNYSSSPSRCANVHANLARPQERRLNARASHPESYSRRASPASHLPRPRRPRLISRSRSLQTRATWRKSRSYLRVVRSGGGREGKEGANAADEAPCPMCGVKLEIASIPGHIERGCPPPKAKARASAAGPSTSGSAKSTWKKLFSGAGAGKAQV